jgi:hypothetical protein
MHAIPIWRVDERKVSLQSPHVGRRGDQRRWGRSKHICLSARRHLLQVLIVEPQCLAVGHQDLRKRLEVIEPEAIGSGEFKCTSGRFHPRSLPILGRGSHNLRKVCTPGFHGFDEFFQII